MIRTALNSQIIKNQSKTILFINNILVLMDDQTMYKQEFV